MGTSTAKVLLNACMNLYLQTPLVNFILGSNLKIMLCFQTKQLHSRFTSVMFPHTFNTLF